MNRLAKKHVIQILLIITIGFVALSILILVFPHSWVDFEFSEEVQEHHSAIEDTIMKAVSWFGQLWASCSLALFAALILFLKKKYREGIFCISTLLVGVVNYAVKTLINRPRPSTSLVRVITDVQHQSFPSGHVSFYIVFFGFITFLFYHKRWLVPLYRYAIITSCITLILTVPVSRIYLGAHWFTDVLGGFLLGSICLGALLLLYLRKETPNTISTLK
jgi:undecaprenyl-diphosphatase